jgi:hypothetical protein
VDRYLKAVAKALPEAQREDIIRETFAAKSRTSKTIWASSYLLIVPEQVRGCFGATTTTL